MIFIYDFVVRLYYILIFLLSPFHKKAAKWISGRRNWEIHLKSQLKPQAKYIWIHCSSLGEYEDMYPVIEAIKSKFPEHMLALSFFSPTGYDFFKNKKAFDVLFYLPLDTRKNGKTLVEILQPVCALFSRSDIWHHVLHALYIQKIPTFLVGVLFHEKSNFLKVPWKWLYVKSFSYYTHIFCRNEITAQLLKTACSLETISVCGNLRIARILNEKFAKSFPIVKVFCQNDYIIVAGSTSETEERMIFELTNAQFPVSVRWIIVPHEVSPSKWSSPEIKKKCALYSSYHAADNSKKILIIDFVGALKYIYQYAHAAIVGGGFTSMGIHNIVEPAVYGVPILTGPNHRKYDEAVALLNIKGLYIFSNTSELHGQLVHIMENFSREQRENLVTACMALSGNSNSVATYIYSKVFEKTE